MKAELMGDILYLRGETDVEHEFLKKAGEEGLWNFETGSTNALALPSDSKQKEVLLDSDQTAMLSYALGKAYSDLERSFGGKKTSELLLMIITPSVRSKRN